MSAMSVDSKATWQQRVALFGALLERGDHECACATRVDLVCESRTVGQWMLLQHRFAGQHSAVDGGHRDGVDRCAVELIEQVRVLD